ncbi:MAG: hypothetical protein V4735_09660 [Pseudomonadota bacterium]
MLADGVAEDNFTLSWRADAQQRYHLELAARDGSVPPVTVRFTLDTNDALAHAKFQMALSPPTLVPCAGEQMGAVMTTPIYSKDTAAPLTPQAPVFTVCAPPERGRSAS